MIIDDGSIWQQIFRDLKEKGSRVAPRGLPVIEIENYSYQFPARVRFCNFESRKLNQDYIKREFLWYLRGDKFDLSILDHASMWKDLVNKDGSINSNYGQYVFDKKYKLKTISQFDNVVQTLLNDPDSRRATISILNSDHLLSDTKDVPCTYSLNFRIRDNKLNMSVHMRSQDAVFGMGNDAPCFSFIHEMMYVNLRDTRYSNLEMGTYHHICDSFHVYERHFGVMEDIASGKSKYIPVVCPEISSKCESDFLRILSNGDLTIDKNSSYNFSKWISTFNTEKK